MEAFQRNCQAHGVVLDGALAKLAVGNSQLNYYSDVAAVTVVDVEEQALGDSVAARRKNP